MLENLTYIFDKIRIALGDSECPLSKRCSNYNLENDNCVTYRGRTEIGGERTDCYKHFKPQIRARKEGLSEEYEKFRKGFILSSPYSFKFNFIKRP